MDLGFFVVGASVGLTIGLVCRYNNIRILPTYQEVDMGVLSKRHYYESQD